MKIQNKKIIVTLEFGKVELNPREIVRYANPSPLYPSKKLACQLKIGELVNVSGFWQNTRGLTLVKI